jgi:hypothetical protein
MNAGEKTGGLVVLDMDSPLAAALDSSDFSDQGARPEDRATCEDARVRG